MDLPLDEGGTCVPACLGRKGGLTTQAGEKSSMAWKADKVHPESGGGWAVEPEEVTCLNVTNISFHPLSAFLSPSSSPLPTPTLCSRGPGAEEERSAGPL